MLRKVTLCLHLLLHQRTECRPKLSTHKHARHRDVCYRTKSSGEGTIGAPSWKYHGTQEDDVSWRSQGAQGVPHRDMSTLLRSSWEAVGSFDAPSWKYTGIQQGDTSR